jgi:hypothetical protein
MLLVSRVSMLQKEGELLPASARFSSMSRDTHSHSLVVVPLVIIPDLLVLSFHETPDLPVIPFAQIPLGNPIKFLLGRELAPNGVKVPRPNLIVLLCSCESRWGSILIGRAAESGVFQRRISVKNFIGCQESE